MCEYSIWLYLCKTVSKRKKARLLQTFGSAQAIFKADKAQLLGAVPELSRADLDSLWKKDLCPAYEILEACADCGAEVIDLLDPAYPPLLREIQDPPAVLFVRGSLPDWRGRLTFAIVGQRKASAAGRKHAAAIAYSLSRSGAVIVSGMADGIDGAAHQGALDGGTPTVAVLGTPIDRCYPAHHAGLMREIIRHGAVISEYPPGAPTYPGNFLSRNRIVSGICRGVLVVEAGGRSGALETAGRALAQNRDVFAVPGPIDSDDYIGTNSLIKNGASAVTCAEDILTAYGASPPSAAPGQPAPAERPWMRRPPLRETGKDSRPVPAAAPKDRPAPAAPDDPGGAVLAAMGQGAHQDEIIERTGLPADTVLTALTMLELQGLVAQRPGNYYEKQR